MPFLPQILDPFVLLFPFFWVQGGLFPPAPVASSRLFLAPQAGLLTVLVPLIGRLRSPGGRRRGVTFFLSRAPRGWGCRTPGAEPTHLEGQKIARCKKYNPSYTEAKDLRRKSAEFVLLGCARLMTEKSPSEVESPPPGENGECQESPSGALCSTMLLP